MVAEKGECLGEGCAWWKGGTVMKFCCGVEDCDGPWSLMMNT
jgi:hypothetical protein